MTAAIASLYTAYHADFSLLVALRAGTLLLKLDIESEALKDLRCNTLVQMEAGKCGD